MSTHAARFGARIGGYRSRARTAVEIPPIADIMAGLWRVDLRTSVSSTLQQTVLAYDANQAIEFARLRAGAPNALGVAHFVGEPGLYQDMTLGVLRVELNEEKDARRERYLRAESDAGASRL